MFFPFQTIYFKKTEITSMCSAAYVKRHRLRKNNYEYCVKRSKILLFIYSITELNDGVIFLNFSCWRNFFVVTSPSSHGSRIKKENSFLIHVFFVKLILFLTFTTILNLYNNLCRKLAQFVCVQVPVPHITFHESAFVYWIIFTLLLKVLHIFVIYAAHRSYQNFNAFAW